MRQFILFSIVLSLLSCSSESDELEVKEFLNDTTIIYKSIPLVNENLTSLDIYTVPNSNSLKPVVVWVHGGAWAIGDKSNKMDTKVPYFRDQDYVFVSVNYRLSPFPYELDNETRVKHPDHITDVADALKWIYDNIDAYGGDTTNIVLLGHSAGAHLVALMGANESLLKNRNINPAHIKGIGSFDTQAYDINRAINSLSEKDLYVNAFGDDEAQQENASPQSHINDTNLVSQNWLFTERGDAVRKDILNDFKTKLQSKNASVTVVNMNDYSHAEVNNLIPDTNNTLLSDAISSFLSTCFK